MGRGIGGGGLDYSHPSKRLNQLINPLDFFGDVDTLRTVCHTVMLGAGEAVVIGFTKIHIEFVDSPKFFAEVVVIKLTE